MTRSGVSLVLATLGLALLPGCLGHTAGSRRDATTREAKRNPAAVPPVAAPEQQKPRALPIASLSMRDVAVAPAENDVSADPLFIRQIVLEKPLPAPMLVVEAVPAAILRPTPSAPDNRDQPPTPSAGAKLATPPSAPPLILALKCVLEDQPDRALEHLKGFDPATQDFLIRVLPAIAKLGHKPLDAWDSEEVAVLHDQFEGVLEALRPLAPLTINRMCCCKSIKGFGQYEPVEEGHLFRAASAKDKTDGEWVNVYIELKNIRCLRRNAYHEIRLASKVEISEPRDPPGKPTWSYTFQDQKQPIRSRAELHDFSNNYTFFVPHLPPGLYTLTIEVEDRTSPEHRRIARQSQEFRVTAMPVATP